MTRRREIQKHSRGLDEIRGIMNAMKNLAYMEMRKISGFLDVQQAVVKQMENVAADFLSFYPDVLATGRNSSIDVYLLIGSERGFCGDFNHALLRRLKDLSTTSTTDKRRLIALGHKLETLLQKDEAAGIFIDGASVAEEVGSVLNQIVNQLAAIQQQVTSLNLHVLYHSDENQLIVEQLLPPFQRLLHQQQQAQAPELNLKPEHFLADLSYHYLFARLNEILYSSLMAESHQRLAHLEGSIQRMDRQSAELHRRSNVLRQEEIIEEIEVILLSALSLDKQATPS